MSHTLHGRDTTNRFANTACGPVHKIAGRYATAANAIVSPTPRASCFHTFTRARAIDTASHATTTPNGNSIVGIVKKPIADRIANQRHARASPLRSAGCNASSPRKIAATIV